MAPPAAGADRRTVALLCSDLGGEGCPVPAGELAASLRRGAPDVRVYVVERLCANPQAIGATLARLGAGRVLVGCRAGRRRRQEMRSALAAAGDSGASRAAVRIVDLSAAEGADPVVVAEQSLVALRSGLARLARAEVEAPLARRLVPRDGGVTRRDLFRTAGLTAQPVAHLRSKRCAAVLGCRLCTLACPEQAIRLEGSGVVVDATACTGCGACLGACREDALSLEDEVLGGYEAAVRSLVAELRRAGAGAAGVAFVCSKAHPVPLGGHSVPLEVPSLEVVSVGWLLGLRAAGVQASLVSCSDERCGRRRHELLALGDTLARWLGTGTLEGLAAATEGFGLREPDATVAPLRCRPGDGAAHPAGSRRIESPVAPLGEVTVSAAGCTACGLCSGACPTGSLTSVVEAERGVSLEFDAARCSACGACVAACPEGVVSLRRVVDAGSIAGGRHRIATAAAGGRCSSCGQPLAGGIVARLIGDRLAVSHPALAARLAEGRCSDCLLVGDGARGRAPAGLPSAEVGLSTMAQ